MPARRLFRFLFEVLADYTLAELLVLAAVSTFWVLVIIVLVWPW